MADAAPRTLISVSELCARCTDPGWIVVDCRFVLRDPDAGRLAYLEGHVPGAVYAHMDHDLSGPIVPGKTGRHPLPDPVALASRLSGWGVSNESRVVAYDDSGGSMAARLWWLLRWLGHDAAAVLDGGWQAWRAAGHPARSGDEPRKPVPFRPRIRPELVVTAALVDETRLDPGWRVLDARAADRYRGENETIDPVAGHIPGAVSAPFGDNLDASGRFRSPEALRERYGEILRGVPAERVVSYCGSGVTAAHDLLAMAHAGLGDARLYPGSWSEWITDPRHAVATGEE